MRLALRSFVVIILPVWWGRGDLNPHALRHMILSHARLPVPTLPPDKNSLNIIAFLLNILLNTLLFYYRCLARS